MPGTPDERKGRVSTIVDGLYTSPRFVLQMADILYIVQGWTKLEFLEWN
jgi:hypothetical protein